MRQIAIYWAPLAAWLGLIFWLSSVPGEQIPMPDFVLSDKVAHSIEYAITGGLFARALGHGGPGLRGLACITTAALAGVLYGLSDELHQGWYPERHRVSDVADAAADAIGSLAGALVLVRVALRRDPS